MYSRKNWECRIYFFKKITVCKSFAVCKKLGIWQIVLLCRVLKLYREFFSQTHDKENFCVCQKFTVCSIFWHTAKIRFAVCPCLCTQQSCGHTAYYRFPVVR